MNLFFLLQPKHCESAENSHVHAGWLRGFSDLLSLFRRVHACEVGSQLRKVPTALHTRLLDFFQPRFLSNQQTVEDWPSYDCHVNFWDTPTLMLFLPDEIKREVERTVKVWRSACMYVCSSLFGVCVYFFTTASFVSRDTHSLVFLLTCSVDYP